MMQIFKDEVSMTCVTTQCLFLMFILLLKTPRSLSVYILMFIQARIKLQRLNNLKPIHEGTVQLLKRTVLKFGDVATLVHVIAKSKVRMTT